MPATIVVTRDLGAKRPHRGSGVQNVLPFQQTFDNRFAHGHGTQNQGTVRDRLVPRHTGLPRKRAPSARAHRLCSPCVD